MKYEYGMEIIGKLIEGKAKINIIFLYTYIYIRIITFSKDYLNDPNVAIIYMCKKMIKFDSKFKVKTRYVF
jgi:hypothetical protein